MIENNITRILDIVSTYNAKILGVTKTVSTEDINLAAQLGISSIGESKVQELESKVDFFSENIKEIHFIGRLQSNKINKCIEMVDFIESVDSLTKAEKIDSSCSKINKIMPVLLQINISQEQTKSGFSQDDIFEQFEKINSLKNIAVSGLMTIGSNIDDEDIIKKDFKKMKLMFDEISRNYSVKNCFKELSMGMSHDFRLALDEGSTIVRLGSVIFGKRSYK